MMNSGCYGTDISEILISIKVLDDMGREKEIKKNEIKFFIEALAYLKIILFYQRF